MKKRNQVKITEQFIKIFFNKLNKFKKIISPQPRPVLAGIWSNKKEFISAIQFLKEKQYSDFSVITPCPIHGMEELLGIRRSWIPWVTFVFGLGGCLFGTWFTWWTSAVDWPLIIGGKPFWSLPAFVPVIFECTILLGALSSVGALLYACGLPAIDPPILDRSLTSHKFAVFFYLDRCKHSSDELEKTLKNLGVQSFVNSVF